MFQCFAIGVKGFGEFAANNHNVRGGQGQREFSRRHVRLIGGVWLQAVVQELASVQTLASGVAEDELNAEDAFVGQFLALVFEIAHGGV